MFKGLKIAKLRNQITEICKDKGYTIHGEIKKCKIDDSSWTFAVKTPNKIFLIKLIVPFGSNNTGLCFNSPEYISATATLFGMRGIGGAINIPITRKYKFKNPQTAFGFEAKKCEKIFLIYPKCTQFYLRETDNNHLTTFRIGLKCGDIHIHDGSSFRNLLETLV